MRQIDTFRLSFALSRDINAGICASVTVLVALAVVAYHLKESLPAFQSVYLFVIAVILVRQIIVSCINVFI